MPALLLLDTTLPDIGLLNAPPAVGRWQGAGIADHDLLAILHLDPAQRGGASARLLQPKQPEESLQKVPRTRRLRCHSLIMLISSFVRPAQGALPLLRTLHSTCSQHLAGCAGAVASLQATQCVSAPQAHL